jgi:hypothetical protein
LVSLSLQVPVNGNCNGFQPDWFSTFLKKYIPRAGIGSLYTQPKAAFRLFCLNGGGGGGGWLTSGDGYDMKNTRKPNGFAAYTIS